MGEADDCANDAPKINNARRLWQTAAVFFGEGAAAGVVRSVLQNRQHPPILAGEPPNLACQPPILSFFLRIFAYTFVPDLREQAENPIQE
jgi:hypothetical protein